MSNEHFGNWGDSAQANLNQTTLKFILVHIKK